MTDSFLKNKLVLFGFPDILFKPFNAYVQLIERMKESQADLL
jgi:hypothetical protein